MITITIITSLTVKSVRIWVTGPTLVPGGMDWEIFTSLNPHCRLVEGGNNRPLDRLTDRCRQTDIRQTDRQTQTHRQTDIQIALDR